jgi:pyrimidine-nucleoside phosphorylase
MNPQDLIRKKRDGGRFVPDEIKAFVRGVCDGSWADYQISALLMAMFVNGLRQTEQHALTEAMLDSGERLDFSAIDLPVADKHSTGGVGDKTSLLIAPLAAACGVAVPMISGRGLGHTGGTLDKLEAISGYNVNLSTAELKKIIGKCGYAMSGQTKRLVPADRKLYALRDATATIESIPLIVASIMSKKLAEGLDALVLDVKTGTGAFMEEESDARKLAKALVKTGSNFGVKTEALLTDMNQPLGKFVGNALEVYECLNLLRGATDEHSKQTLELSVELAARMLTLTKTEKSHKAAREKIRGALESGAALEKFRENVLLQGGDDRICDAPETLFDDALLKVPIKAPDDGFVNGIDAKAIGEAVAAIGGGRVQIGDKIDAAVGYACEKKLGEKTREHEPLGFLYCRSEAQAAKVLAKLQMAYKIGVEKPVRKFELVKEVIS